VNTYASVAALLRLWPDLPRKTGQTWPGLYWQLLDLLRRFERAADEEDKAAAAIDILRVVRTLPGGVEALRAVQPPEILRWEGTTEHLRGEGGIKGLFTPEAFSPPRAGPAPTLDAVLHPPTVTRYTDVYAPHRVQVGQRFPIVVGLTRSPADAGEEVAAIQAELDQQIRVELTPRGPELLGERAKDLRVTPQDSEPVVFFLRAVESREQSVTIDFRSGNHLLASIERVIQAVEEPEPMQFTQSATGALAIGDYRAPFPDAVLRIITRDNRLSFSVLYRDMEERHIEGDLLRADPEEYRYTLIREIENLARGKDAEGYPLSDVPDQPLSPEDLARHLERIGQRLYGDLFSEAMQREYHRMKEKDVHTLYLVSDEPWIPWELVKPYDDVVDDDFLCLQFELSRWVSGSPAPTAEIGVDSLACVAPTDSNLSCAIMEQAFVRDLAQKQGLADRTPATPDRGSVRALLEGDTPVQLWHFACHGDFDAQAPGNSPLLLQYRRPLRPNNLVGPAQTRLRTDRPLVFLNACRVGQAGLSLTGLGGWAKKLVQDCHVSALLAPMWSVNDTLAQWFAEEFYIALEEPGATLGMAMRAARRKLKEHSPDKTTWLSYSLYAHPNARVVFRPDGTGV